MTDCLIIAAMKLEIAKLVVAHVLMWSDAHGNSQRSHFGQVQWSRYDHSCKLIKRIGCLK